MTTGNLLKHFRFKNARILEYFLDVRLVYTFQDLVNFRKPNHHITLKKRRVERVHHRRNRWYLMSGKTGHFKSGVYRKSRVENILNKQVTLVSSEYIRSILPQDCKRNFTDCQEQSYELQTLSIPFHTD